MLERSGISLRHFLSEVDDKSQPMITKHPCPFALSSVFIRSVKWESFFNENGIKRDETFVCRPTSGNALPAVYAICNKRSRRLPPRYWRKRLFSIGCSRSANMGVKIFELSCKYSIKLVTETQGEFNSIQWFVHCGLFHLVNSEIKINFSCSCNSLHYNGVNKMTDDLANSFAFPLKKLDGSISEY